MSDTHIHDTSFEKISPSEVTVLVLNYNGSEDTIACLRALSQLDIPPLRTIVIDNASSDDSVKKIFAAWSSFAETVTLAEQDACKPALLSKNIILLLPSNRGYAAGNNAGIRLARTDVNCKAVWILNNDTEPEPQALGALCNRMNREGAYCVVGSTLIYAHDRKTVQCLAGSSLNKFLGTTQHIYHGINFDYICNEFIENVESYLDYISGASLFVHINILRITGMLCEEFFMYYEDVEYGMRIKKCGFRLVWAKDSIVYHKDGSSTKNDSIVYKKIYDLKKWKECLIIQNRILFMRKNYLCMLPFVLLSYTWIAIKKVWIKRQLSLYDMMRSIYNGITIKVI